MRHDTVATATARVPTRSAVWIEQFRVSGLAMRREATLLALLALVPSAALVLLDRAGILSLVSDSVPMRDLSLDPTPVLGTLAAFMALLFPLALWKGERRFADTPLWSLPVDHSRHVLVKVATGWAWLFLLVGGAMLYFLALAVLGGSTLGVEHVRHVLLAPAGAGAGPATEVVRWTTHWWEWLLPLVAATAAYLVATALVLGTRHPVPWAVGLWLLVLVTGEVGHDLGIEWMARPLDSMVVALGEWEILETIITLADGERVRALSSVPSLGTWAANTAAWFVLGLGGTLAGAFRRR